MPAPTVAQILPGATPTMPAMAADSVTAKGIGILKALPHLQQLTLFRTEIGRVRVQEHREALAG
jgi:hypothetical protein